ncbi:maternal effect embryo arrest 60 [Striga asiatica]|uniref:Maternal effect embryo arrest 60 n=1 Tax=Striga asiatica TaxID=4170 RepID=A0A5A7RH50_STRAF|nr:maternal effect embryo arrest 60 [Striga asiatica]
MIKYIFFPHHGSSRTSIHITALDGTLNVNSLFTLAVFLGIFINPADPTSSLVGTTACAASSTVAKQFVEFHVYSFSSFLFSSLIASCLKLAIRTDDGIHRPSAGHVNLRVLRAGILATACGSVVGCAFLGLALVNLMQIKLGSLGCWGWHTLGAIGPLVILVPVALLIYICLLCYAFTR